MKKRINPNSYVRELIDPNSQCWRVDLIDQIFIPLKLVKLKASLSVQIEGKIAFYEKIVEDSFFGPHGITSLATHATSTYYDVLG